MIIETLFNLIFGLINLVFNLLPSLPDFSENMLTDFHTALETIFDNTGLLGFFFPISSIKLFIPLVILVINFEHVYNAALWVITWIKSHD